MTFPTAEVAYHKTLERLLGEGRDDGLGNLEIINLAFEVADPSLVEFRSPTRRFRTEFARRFLDFILSGSPDASVLFGSNPNARKFASRDSVYGPRIAAQLPAIIDELTACPGSRRAVITILHAEDQAILPEKRTGSGAEYPCTVSLIFLVRDRKLHLHVMMRSNNMTTTVCYDLYNFMGIQRVVLERLRASGLDIELGSYFHVCASAHILKDEIDLARRIVDEYLGTKI